MNREIVFDYNIEKPFTEKELLDFKKFKIEVKALIIKGKVNVKEKFKVFTFTINDYSIDEKNKVNAFLINNNFKTK